MSRSVTLQACERTFSTSVTSSAGARPAATAWRSSADVAPAPRRSADAVAFRNLAIPIIHASATCFMRVVPKQASSHRHALGSSRTRYPEMSMCRRQRARIRNHQSFPAGRRVCHAAASRTRSRISSGLSTRRVYRVHHADEYNLPRAAMLSNDPEHAFRISFTGQLDVEAPSLQRNNFGSRFS